MPDKYSNKVTPKTLVERKVTKVDRRHIKKMLKETGKWRGYLAGNKVNPWHVVNGWHLGFLVEVTSTEDLENRVLFFEPYLHPDQGTRTVFYEEVTS